MTPTVAIRTLTLLALLVTAPISALACSAAGPNAHVGKVLSVDKSAGTFTLLDAETMSPVTLSADAALLDRVASIVYHADRNNSGSVVVTYEKNGDSLRALELK